MQNSKFICDKLEIEDCHKTTMKNLKFTLINLKFNYLIQKNNEKCKIHSDRIENWVLLQIQNRKLVNTSENW